MTDEPPPLLPDEIRARLPPLYATESDPDPLVRARLFTPWTVWTWYITEFDGADTCFGLVSGHEVELGYFSLSDIAAVEGPGGLRVERDLHFEPKPLSQVREEVARMRGQTSDKPEDRCSEFNAAGQYWARDGRDASALQGAIPSPFVNPGIRLVETRLGDARSQPQWPNCLRAR